MMCHNCTNHQKEPRKCKKGHWDIDINAAFPLNIQVFECEDYNNPKEAHKSIFTPCAIIGCQSPANMNGYCNKPGHGGANEPVLEPGERAIRKHACVGCPK